MTQMKGISYCSECSFYQWDKDWYKCTRAKDEGCGRFYADCPLPDVVPVVRCKDCMHYAAELGSCNMFEETDAHGDIEYRMYVPEDWYCADGEREEDDG